jgi:thiol-disulfide isomerase/thioredoxin
MLSCRWVGLVFVISIGGQAADPRLRIGPARPHPGEKLTITYSPRGGPLENSEAITLIHGSTPGQSSRTPMQRQGARFTATVDAWLGTSYLWCWVEDSVTKIRDSNRGTAWDTYLYDNKGAPVEGARANRADLYQMRNQPIDIKTAQLELLDEELRQYPSNGYARGKWWMIRAMDAGTAEARDQIAAEIADFLKSNADKSWAYRAAADGYHGIGRTPQAVETVRAMARRFPDDPDLVNLVWFYFSFFGTPADLEGLRATSKKWESDERYWEALFHAYEKSPPKPELLQSVGEKWVAFAPLKSHGRAADVRIRVAEAWLANGVDPAAAERIAREALTVAERGGTFQRNSFVNPTFNPRTMLTRMHRSTLAWALYRQAKYEDALREFERTIAIGDKEKIAMTSVYYRLGQTLERLNRPDDALVGYYKELAWGSDTAAQKAASELYAKAHGGLQGFDADFRSHVNELVAKAAVPEPVEDTNEKLGRFVLRGPDGQAVDLSRYQGKVVIIDFWATWCGPCIASLENTNKLARQFPGKVAVLAVSTDGEETRARVKPLLNERGYEFVLLFDDESQRDLTIPYIPSRFLLDRHGRVRVRDIGTSMSADIVFEQKLRELIAEP